MVRNAHGSLVRMDTALWSKTGSASSRLKVCTVCFAARIPVACVIKQGQGAKAVTAVQGANVRPQLLHSRRHCAMWVRTLRCSSSLRLGACCCRSGAAHRTLAAQLQQPGTVGECVSVQQAFRVVDVQHGNDGMYLFFARTEDLAWSVAVENEGMRLRYTSTEPARMLKKVSPGVP